jgi:NAD(P)-dependent dehydrogenase (short-subunit alcohol dehydrogenase family)
MNHREIVVITGASAGVGRAAARRFARGGADVALLARGREGLEAARKEVEQLGGRALVIPTDVADPEEVNGAADLVERELGPIDVWVNDAMVTVFGEFKTMTAVEFKRVTEVSYLGFVYGTQAALRHMLPRNRGTIVQVGSALAYRGIPLQSAYCGAKHAIRGFTDSVRTELLHDRSNVWITMVQMPALNTPQFGWCKSKMPLKAQPVPPIYEPEVAAEGIHFAAHHRRREVEVGLSTTIVVAGNKVAPGLGDWYLGRTGVKSQQIKGAPETQRPNNLWEPLDAETDHGARGSFSGRALGHSIGLSFAKHKGVVAGLGVALVAMTASFAWRALR